MLGIELTDDGTMDTVLECECSKCGRIWTERFSCEYAADYRDEDGAMADLAGLMDDVYCDCG